MKRFVIILKKLMPYKKYLLASILFNVLTSLFTIAGIPLFIPFFELIFNPEESIDGMSAQEEGVKGEAIRFLGDLIDPTDPVSALKIIVTLFILTFLLKNLFRYFSLYFLAPMRNGFIRDLRNDLFTKLLKQPVGYFKHEKKGDLLSRMSLDIQEVESSILTILDALIKAPILIFGSLIFMFFISHELTLLVLLLMPFTVFIVGGLSRKLKKQSGIAQHQLGEIMSIMDETITGIKVIKSFNASESIGQKFFRSINQYKTLLTKIYRRRDAGSPLAEILAVLVIALIMYYAGSLVFSQKMMPQTFFAFIYAFFIIIDPAKSFSAAFYSYKKGDAAMERLQRILELDSVESDAKGALEHLDFTDAVHFENVFFKYPENERWVLESFNLRIQKGEKIAIVGGSGAGKTTLADLLLRFIDPAEGTIYVDGINLKHIKRHSIRQMIGMVNQDATLFNDTIANNMLIGNPDASIQEIKNAAEIADIADFIESLPQKYESIIGEQGSKLSGGQKQRVAIARAILKNAPVLILDEATSALDSTSEKKVQVALKRALEGKTALIIAHRLSTIREADRIIVLKEGKMIESGNHDELMQKMGEYYKFVHLQSLKDLD